MEHREAAARHRSDSRGLARPRRRAACPQRPSGTTGTTSATPTRGCTPSCRRRSMRSTASREPVEKRSDEIVVLRGEREDRAVVVGSEWTSSTSARAAKARGERPEQRGISPLGDVGHGLEHDPYPTKPCLRTSSRARRRAAGARSGACSASCARTGLARRLVAPRDRVAGRGRSSSPSSRASSSTRSTAARTRGCSRSRSARSSPSGSFAAR